MGNDCCRPCCRPKDVVEVTHKTPFGEVTQRNVIDHNQQNPAYQPTPNFQ
jgi:hypothetical protein